MMSNSEPTEPSRKTLDEIRREIDAEFGFPEIGDRSPDRRSEASEVPAVDRSSHARVPAVDRSSHARDIRVDRRRDEPRPDGRRAVEWNDPDSADEDAIDVRLARFREEVYRRHQSATERRREEAEGTPRRSGYLVAALVGCVVGQALLLAFFLGTRYGVVPDISGPSGLMSSGSDVATAATPVRPVVEDPQPSPESRPQAAESAAVASPEPAVDLPLRVAPEPPRVSPEPPRIAPEPPASSSRQPAIVSAATARDSAASRVVQAPRPAPAKVPGVAARDVAESQARLRAALNDWLRTSARGGAPIQTTEPVIVLGPDGRTAKTSLSVSSPIGLIPREQRWELGARGWTLVDDRQAGLPIAR